MNALEIIPAGIAHRLQNIIQSAMFHIESEQKESALTTLRELSAVIGSHTDRGLPSRGLPSQPTGKKQ